MRKKILTVPRVLHLNETALKKLGVQTSSSIESLEEQLNTVQDRQQELEQKAVLTARDVLELPLAEWIGIERTVYWDETEKSVRLTMGKEKWREYLLMQYLKSEAVATLTR